MQTPDNQHGRESDLAFMTLALRKVEAHGQADCERDALIRRLLAEMAELVRRGTGLNDIESIYGHLSDESKVVFSAALNSISENPQAFAASFAQTERMLARAEAFTAWKQSRRDNRYRV